MANSYEFYLRHSSRAGVVKQAVLSPAWLYLTMRKYSGGLTFGLGGKPLDPGDARATRWQEVVDTFEDYDIVEVWWRNLGLGIDDGSGGFVRLARTIYREREVPTDDAGVTAWVGECISRWGVLDWRKTVWPSGVDLRTSFSSQPSETVGKLLVQYHCTSDATVANGRWRDGDLAPGMGITITIASDLSRGNSISPRTEGGGVLAVVRDVAAISGGDFTLDWTSETALTFDYNPGQQGVDRFDSVIFALARRNMRRPVLRRRAIGRGTVAVVAGQGEGVARLTEEVPGGDYAAGNDIEFYVDARDLADSSALVTRGEELLHQQRATTGIDFEAVQTADTFFSNVEVAGRNNYFVGDIVQASYFGTYRRQVTGAIIDWRTRVPRITIEMKDVD